MGALFNKLWVTCFIEHHIRVKRHEGQKYMLNERSPVCVKWRNSHRKKCRIIHFVHRAQNYIYRRYAGKCLGRSWKVTHQIVISDYLWQVRRARRNFSFVHFTVYIIWNIYLWDQKRKKVACSTNVLSPLIRIIDNGIIRIIDAWFLLNTLLLVVLWIPRTRVVSSTRVELVSEWKAHETKIFIVLDCLTKSLPLDYYTISCLLSDGWRWWWQKRKEKQRQAQVNKSTIMQKEKAKRQNFFFSKWLVISVFTWRQY